MFFDSHVHFDGLESSGGLDAVVARAEEVGVKRMIAVGGSLEANKFAITAAARFPETVRAAIGYDRDQARELLSRAEGIQSVVFLLKSDIARLSDQGTAVAAIGEIGLDFHYSPDTAEAQVELFREQLRLARQLDLPVIVHSREADEQTITELRMHWEIWFGPDERIGVLHCFTGGREFAQKILDLNFYISFSGIITFHAASELREAARVVPDDQLLIETDSPYLAPVPHRGKSNEPAYVRYVAETLAEVRGCDVERIAELTAENAERLFPSHVRLK